MCLDVNLSPPANLPVPGVSVPGVCGLWPVAGPCGSGHPWKHPWTSARLCCCCTVVSCGGGGNSGDVGGGGGGVSGGCISGVKDDVNCVDGCDSWYKLKFIQIEMFHICLFHTTSIARWSAQIAHQGQLAHHVGKNYGSPSTHASYFIAGHASYQ